MKNNSNAREAFTLLPLLRAVIDNDWRKIAARNYKQTKLSGHKHGAQLTLTFCIARDCQKKTTRAAWSISRNSINVVNVNVPTAF